MQLPFLVLLQSFSKNKNLIFAKVEYLKIQDKMNSDMAQASECFLKVEQTERSDVSEFMDSADYEAAELTLDSDNVETFDQLYFRVLFSLSNCFDR